MGLLFLQRKQKVRGHETLTHTLTKRIKDKTNQNNNNKKQIKKKTIKKKRFKKKTKQIFYVLLPSPDLNKEIKITGLK